MRGYTWLWVLLGIVLGILAGFAALAAWPDPAAALPIGDTLGLGETLTWTVMHNGPACSSGWVLVAAGCVAEDDERRLLPSPDPVALPLGLSEASMAWAPASDPPLAQNPEPATLLLLATGLGAAAWASRRRRRSPQPQRRRA